MAKVKFYAEVPTNLITVPQGFVPVFAVSSDMNMSVGLPKIMNDTFHIDKKLDNLFDGDYEAGTAEIFGNVIAVIVKENANDRADEEYLKDALTDLKIKCTRAGYDKIAMPKLCCGNNGLKWSKVKKMIKDIFKDSGIFVMVCV